MGAGAETTRLSARLLGPDLLERGRPNALSCPLYQNGALVAPTQSGSTVSIYDAAGTVQVDAAAVTVSGSVARYSYTPATSLSLAEGWRVEWSLIVAGTTHVFRNTAALVRFALYPVISDPDLFRRVSGLDPSGSSPISSVADYQDYIDEAWAKIQLGLINKGNRPNLILEPTALRELHLNETLHLIFDDFATRLNAAYTKQAESYRAKASNAWGELRFVYDVSDAGKSEDPQRRRSGTPTVWLCGRG